MQENVGGMDRAMRIVVGPGLILAGITALGGSKGRPLGLAAVAAGALVTQTIITKVCPVNRLLGIDTRRPELARPASDRDLKSLQMESTVATGAASPS